MRSLHAMAFAPYGDVPAGLRAPGFAAPAPDETALVVFDGHTTFAFNLVAAFVWDLLDGTRSTDALVSAVSAAFSVEPRTARDDVTRVCADFLSAGLVEPVREVQQARS
jgi:hypothetical protein